MKKRENSYIIRQLIFQIKSELDYIELYAKKQRKKLEELDNFLSEQEQPEVDLEKEIDSEWKKCNPIDEGMGVESAYMHIEAFDIIARHFYELGRLKTMEEDK